jgi:hypothetical protein
MQRVIFNAQSYHYDIGNRICCAFADRSGPGRKWFSGRGGLLGFGVGAILGSALAPQAVYVAPPPPPVYYVPPPSPVYYGAVIYGSPAYRYHHHRHRHR